MPTFASIMDYQAIIDRYYPEDSQLRRLLLKHSRQVADRCLSICDARPSLSLDRSFLEEAAMLHDVGIRYCHAPSIFCEGDEPYIRHGIIGARLMEQLGYERHARVCARHTGTGITLWQIEKQQLPLPPGDYVPETMEEQLVCYADKFYSKSRPDRELSVEQTAESLRRFGEEGVEKFLAWARLFEGWREG